jgi:hypothetical protein
MPRIDDEKEKDYAYKEENDTGIDRGVRAPRPHYKKTAPGQALAQFEKQVR